MTPVHTIRFNSAHGTTERDLPILPVDPTTSVAVFNVLGDWELVGAVGRALAHKYIMARGKEDQWAQALIMPEGKAVALLHVLGTILRIPTVVARKEHKSYMGENPLTVSYKSITTGRFQTLYLSMEDAKKIAGLRVAFADDVISTGGSLDATCDLAKKADARIVALLAGYTEGTRRENVISLGHLPLFHPDGTPKA